MSLLQAFQDVAADLNTVLVERESAIHTSFLALLTGEHFLQLGSPGCLDGQTPIIYCRGKRNGGRRTTLERLYKNFNNLEIRQGHAHGRAWQDRSVPTLLHSYDFETGRVFYNQIVSVLASGVKTCLSMEISSGEKIVLTADHPVLTPDGFVQAGELVPGSPVICRGSMRPVKQFTKSPQRDRIVVTALKYYRSGYDGTIKDPNTGAIYPYRRQHRARLVVEASMNGMTYKQYVHCLKNDPAAIDLLCLPQAVDVHHKNERTLDDRLDNLEVLPHAEHTKEHDPLARFNVEYVKTAIVVSTSTAGERETFDIQMAAPANNFATAAGLIVHNTAKSLLVDELHARITGAQKFKLLLNQSTAPDELFGPVDLIQLADAGIYTRRRAGSLTEAHIAFLDEIGRGNSVVRNALLQVMNERTLNELGMPTRSVPLISLFAASNSSLAEDEDLRAFDDRFVLREVVPAIGDDDAFIKMLTAKVHPPQAFLSLDQIQAAQQEVCAVQGSREVLDIIVGLRTACAQEGIAVSPRRWKKALKIAKAEAWLDGCSTVEVEHLLCLTSVLWVAPAEERVVQRLVYAAACPLYFTALEAEDSAEDLVKNLPREDSSDWDAASENCLLQISDIHKHLQRQISRSSAKNQTKAQAPLAKIAALHTQVSRSLLKRLERLQLASAK